MRGVVAKRIRRDVYGDYSPQNREYKGRFIKRTLAGWLMPKNAGKVEADARRKAYKAAKKAYKNANIT